MRLMDAGLLLVLVYSAPIVRRQAGQMQYPANWMALASTSPQKSQLPAGRCFLSTVSYTHLKSRVVQAQDAAEHAVVGVERKGKGAALVGQVLEMCIRDRPWPER